MSPPILSALRVTKTFLPSLRGRVARRRGAGGVPALADVTLEVQEHEFVCLLGVSGCGKSTFLNIVAGFEPPTSGQVLLRGSAIRGPGVDRGVVFQEESLFPWLNLTENVEFGLRVRGLDPAARRETAARHIELVGLQGFASLYPSQLSGGMKQRVAIARALANDPEIVLMDEPFGALDILTREVLQQELLGVWLHTRKTILFVTHSVEESILLADRIVVFTRGPGRIKEIIPVDLPRPRERAQARFLELDAYVRSAIHAELAEARPGDGGAGR